VSRKYDCSDPLERTKGLADAVESLRRGDLVVLPTDTVYGIGADAFSPSAVNALLGAKGRDRDMPVPVLVGTVRAAGALTEGSFGTYGQDLLDEFWPGALTVVLRANPNLSWDLGETKGTVAVRMPLHDLALQLLKEIGPMAVSSANVTGNPPARTAAAAEEQLGDSVAVYLDAGQSGDAPPSSIVDLTGSIPRLLRAGAIPEEKLREVLGVLLVDYDEEEDDGKEDDGKEDDGQAAADTEAKDEDAKDEGAKDEGAKDEGAKDEGAKDEGAKDEAVEGKAADGKVAEAETANDEAVKDEAGKGDAKTE
jgi:tRNA threonylcarbamoyl adenosine modification protein (Sua5/YciO/YrdC/YwlC family)